MLFWKKKKPVAAFPYQYRFEEDFKFLHSIILDEITRSIVSFEGRLHRNQALLEKDVQALTTEISFRVLSILSDNYISTLLNYMSMEGISYYVNNRIMDEIINYGVERNLNILNDPKESGSKIL